MIGLHQLFPRVLQYLKDPTTSVADITSPKMDGIILYSSKKSDKWQSICQNFPN